LKRAVCRNSNIRPQPTNSRVVRILLVLGILAASVAGAPGLRADEGHRHAPGHAGETAPAATPFKPLKEGIRAVRGSQVYRDRCVSCHGRQGDGQGPAAAGLDKPVPDFTAPQALVTYTAARMLTALRQGHGTAAGKDGKSPLSEQDAKDVVDFIGDAFMLPSGTADASVGRKIFARTCSVCHGDRGNAASWAKNSLDPPPFDFTSYKAKKLSRRHMINTVTYGSEKSAMVGFATQLSQNEIAAVVDYIRQAFIFPEKLADEGKTPPAGSPPGGHGHNHEGGSHEMARAFAGGLSGDVTRGKKLYQSNCSACHGVQGNGDGPRAYFIFPRPENFTGKRARAELNRPHLFQSIAKGITGTVMPAWATVLTDQQIADVAEFIFSRFIMADARQSPSKLFKENGEGGGAPAEDRAEPPSKKN